MNQEEILKRIDFLQEEIFFFKKEAEKFLFEIEKRCKEILDLEDKIKSNE